MIITRERGGRDIRGGGCGRQGLPKCTYYQNIVTSKKIVTPCLIFFPK